MIDMSVIKVICAGFLLCTFVLLACYRKLVARYSVWKHYNKIPSGTHVYLPTRVPIEYVFQYKQKWFGGFKVRGGQCDSGNMAELRASSAIDGLITEIICRANRESLVLTSERNMYVCNFSNPKDVGEELYAADIQVVGSLTDIMGLGVDYIDWSCDSMILFTDVLGSKWMYTTKEYFIEELDVAGVHVEKIGRGILHKLCIYKALIPCDILDYHYGFVVATGEGKLFRFAPFECITGRNSRPIGLSSEKLRPSRWISPEINMYFDRKRTQTVTQRCYMKLVRGDDSCAYLFGKYLETRSAEGHKVTILGSDQDYENITKCYNMSNGVYLLDRCGRWFYAGYRLTKWEDTVEFLEIPEYRGMEFLGGSDNGLFQFALVDKVNDRILIEHEDYLIPVRNSVCFSGYPRRTSGRKLSMMVNLFANYATSTGRRTKNARITKSLE